MQGLGAITAAVTLHLEYMYFSEFAGELLSRKNVLILQLVTSRQVSYLPLILSFTVRRSIPVLLTDCGVNYKVGIHQSVLAYGNCKKKGACVNLL